MVSSGAGPRFRLESSFQPIVRVGITSCSVGSFVANAKSGAAGGGAGGGGAGGGAGATGGASSTMSGTTSGSQSSIMGARVKITGFFRGANVMRTGSSAHVNDWHLLTRN